MKSTDLIKELAAAGCECKRHNGGSHQIWWSPITGKTFPVPHPKKDLPLGTVKSIKKWRGSNPRLFGGNMFFSVGVETPKDDATAYGLIVPALCTDDYGCFSAADSQQDIARMAREAILALIDEAVSRGSLDIKRLNDAGYLIYAAMPDFADYDSWFVLDVDLSAFEGKPQRLNISLPDTLIQRIDNRVREQPGTYRDRSHFLAEAARHELE